ncbi:MAG: ribonuclease HI [Oligoflexales bacterium]
MKKVTLVTDGACLGNPGPGGWAAFLRFGKHEKLLSGGNPATTNNQMEMTAVIEGLKALKEQCKVEVISDSRYIIDCFEQGWFDNWQRNGWKTAQNKPVKNKELWIDMANQLARHKVDFTWVKGHSGHPENEMVDQEANRKAREFQEVDAPT